jgi:tripartite ATP-independent transporter DctM subunit
VVVVVLGPVADVSVGDLFVGMIFPGLIMATMYVVYILGRCTLDPKAGPRLPRTADEPPLMVKIRITSQAMVPPVLMIFAVLGSIMMGWAAPTEAAGLGAFGAIVLTIVYGRFSFRILQETVIKTLKITCMIMVILLCGNMFAGVFIASGGVALTQQLISSADLGPWLTLAAFLLVCFIAGFFLDWISVLLIFIPVFIPLVREFGFDPVWFCVMFLVVIQTSYLTPPMAPAIFYLRGISPPEITLRDMFRGVTPFIVLQIVTLIIIATFPDTVLWLPAKVLGFR